MPGWSIVRTLSPKKRKDRKNDLWTDGWMDIYIYIIGLARWLSMPDSGGVHL